ncbi:hypothetical protein SAMN06265218_12138 [Fodinibius sediminis]|uniref:Uncharacterized protein n=1 Tax=Fodinibius sediminis TaxID=1214077 RepID=A0A521F1B6_9BACT|nr:hypothetical protein SAMN06265218_12138 [Fodinibius sediminis]
MRLDLLEVGVISNTITMEASNKNGEEVCLPEFPDHVHKDAQSIAESYRQLGDQPNAFEPNLPYVREKYPAFEWPVTRKLIQNYFLKCSN